MAGSVSTSVATANAALDAGLDLTNAGASAGLCVVYDGTPPADARTALSGNTVLVTFTLNDPAWSAAASGSKALDVTGGISAAASTTGTASFARILDSDSNVVTQGAVATSGEAFTISSTSITSGQTVDLLSGTMSQA